MSTRKQASYLIHYDGRTRFAFDLYIYRDGRPIWIASMEHSRDADKIADVASLWRGQE